MSTEELEADLRKLARTLFPNRQANQSKIMIQAANAMKAQRARIAELEAPQIVPAMKIAAWGEFQLLATDEHGNVCQTTVPWTTCKEIYKAMHKARG